MSKEDEFDREIIDALKQIKEARAINTSVNQRDNEIQYMLWLDKELMGKLKFKALKNSTTVKDLIEISVRRLLNEY